MAPIRQAKFVSPKALQRHYERIAQGYVAAVSRAMDQGEITPADLKIVSWA